MTNLNFPDNPRFHSPDRANEARRIAVFGGDGRPTNGLPSGEHVHLFRSRGQGGNGGLKKLSASIKAGTVDLVIVLGHWIGHVAQKRLRALCRANRVRFVIYAGRSRIRPPSSSREGGRRSDR